MEQKTGLTLVEAEKALAQYGPNRIEEKKEGFVKKLLVWAVSPISLMLLAALVLTRIGQKYFDFYLILGLWAVNFLINFWQEKKVDNAIQSLQKELSVRTRVLRGGVWTFMVSDYLVPGDVVEIGPGDIVPADLKILVATSASFNESALTGESLPKEKQAGENAYAGSFIVSGFVRAEVSATGVGTRFGKTLMLIDRSLRRSILERDILSISKTVSLLSIVVLTIFSTVFLINHEPLSELLTLGLSLLIAGIPISLPTVMTIIIALGVTELAKRGAVVRRLSSLEDFANVDVLLSDKTGTLTQNKLSIKKIITYGSHSEKDALKYALFSVYDGEKNEIDRIIVQAAKKAGIDFKGEFLKFIPADSNRKRSTSWVKEGAKKLTVSFGAPQIIEGLSAMPPREKRTFNSDIKDFAKNGYRALALAVRSGEQEKSMKLVALFAISDTLLPEAGEVIDFMKQNGIAVKMVTGDNEEIGRQVASELGLSGEAASAADFKGLNWAGVSRDWFEKKTVFSEVLPEDKYHLVETARRWHTVAVTGDGVNDLPALKEADVGIAVANAVSALKGAADIVLLSGGINTIKAALIEARKIFARLYVYSVYRISESFRVIITIGVLGIIYGKYPLTAVQLILLAVLNDAPIISLAFNRVQAPTKPAKINPRKRLFLSSMFALAGIANSLIMFFIVTKVLNLPLGMVQTIFFLKLTVSGHMLIYVAHTKQVWYKFLPSNQVIWATTLTQLAASLAAGFGIFMSAIPFTYIVLVWAWAGIWMQASEILKQLVRKHY